MVALQGKPDIGDQINKKILGPLAKADQLSDMPDFNDPNKLGSGFARMRDAMLNHGLSEPTIRQQDGFECHWVGDSGDRGAAQQATEDNHG